jgi:NADPH-dependent curcumin reductase CurA
LSDRPTNIIAREILLKQRPEGLPDAGTFELRERPLAPPGAGEVLVRNIWMSVDPYMRGRIGDAPSYAPPFPVGEPMRGGAIGEVIASNAPSLKAGDLVSSMLGWRDYYVAPAETLEKVDPALGPAQHQLGALGMPGLTAYVGLTRIADLKDGDSVFVSAAAGAVGSTACQIAKARGCRVVGSAGSDAKCAWLREALHVDATINYRAESDLSAALSRAAPDGIDVYYENVGGEHLVAALDNMKVGGRIAVCGMIARYNSTGPIVGPANIVQVLIRRLKMQGFIVSDHFALIPAFRNEMAGWIKAGTITVQETVVEGLENAPSAFLGLFKGDNLGKMLVRIGPDTA